MAPYAFGLAFAALFAPLSGTGATVQRAATAAPSTVAAADSERADDDIRQVALHHATDVRRCYEGQGLRRNPALSGVVEIELRVLPTGVVDSARVSASQLAGSGKLEVERCLVDAARNWRFDRGPFGVEMIVYPFTLTPTEAEAKRFQSA